MSGASFNCQTNDEVLFICQTWIFLWKEWKEEICCQCLIREGFREKFKNNRPDIRFRSATVMGKAGGDKWKSMTEEEKALYETWDLSLLVFLRRLWKSGFDLYLLFFPPFPPVSTLSNLISFCC